MEDIARAALRSLEAEDHLNSSPGSSYAPTPEATRLQMASSQSLRLMSSGTDGAFLSEDVELAVSGRKDADNDRNVETPGRVLPSVGAFTVQCAKCLKWRRIPTKDLYEEIRQFIIEDPFFCNRASRWRPNASCDDPPDLSQDMSHLWAIDRPNIPLAPTGWERLLVLRGAGASKFADVYYRAPTGRKLRSMPEVERFLADHPDYVNAGVRLSQFSFVIPKPLDKDYVRKRSTGAPSEMRGSIVHKKPRDGKVGPNRSSFRPSSSKERSVKLVARKKSLAQILGSGQSQGLQGASQGLFLLDGNRTHAQQAPGIPSPWEVVVFKEPVVLTVQECGKVVDSQIMGDQSQIWADMQNSVHGSSCLVSAVQENKCTDLIQVFPGLSTCTRFDEKATPVREGNDICGGVRGVSFPETDSGQPLF